MKKNKIQGGESKYLSIHLFVFLRDLLHNAVDISIVYFIVEIFILFYVDNVT